jgi:cytoskeletal protein RodZ
VARIELIHDRLVPVVSRARERRAAAEREQAEREAREAAEREAAEQAARREEAEAAQARMRRMRNLSMGALVAVVVLAILGAWAALQANRARNEALTMQSELQRSFDDQQRLLATTRSAERAASAAVDQERKAREETVHQGRVARARELIAHALQQAPLDTELSALLAAEALKTAPLPEAQDALSKALSSWHQERRIEVGGALVRMAALGDGRFAVAAADGSLSFVTPASGKVQALGRLEGQPAGTTVVDSGRIVVAWGAKGAAPVAAAWDVSNGRLLWRRTLGALSGSACCARLLELGNERVQLIDARTGAPVVELKVDFLHTAAFSADGRSFVTVGGWRDPARPLSCLGSELQRHDSADGHLLGAPVHSGEGDGTWALAPEGGGAIVSSRGPAEHCSGYREQATWVTASGRSVGLGGSPGRLQLVRVQGGRAALASGPMTQIWLLSASDGSSEPTARIGGSMLHGADVRALAWQGDESGLIASADAAGVLRAWATQYDGPPRPLVVLAAGHGPTDVAFNRDRLVSIGNDGTLRVWTLPDLRPFAEPAKPGIPCLRCKSPEDWLVESRRRIGRDFNAEERRRFAISESGTAAAVTASAPSAISQRTEQAP